MSAYAQALITLILHLDDTGMTWQSLSPATKFLAVNAFVKLFLSLSRCQDGNACSASPISASFKRRVSLHHQIFLVLDTRFMT